MSFVAAAIGVVGAVAGGAIAAGGAESAAQTQANAAQNAQNLQQSMFNTQMTNQQPFRQAGYGSINELNYLMGMGQQSDYNSNTGAPYSSSAGAFGSLNAPFNAQTFKSQSPQYQFNLQQGGQGVLNQASSSLGAESPAALKDLIAFNQGYANNSYNSAFGNYQTQQNNIFSRLNSIAGLGQAAASNQATGASNFAQGISNSAQNVGTALAGGTVGAANALSGGLQSAVPWLMAGQNGNSAEANAGYGAFTGANAGDPMYQTPTFNPSLSGSPGANQGGF